MAKKILHSDLDAFDQLFRLMYPRLVRYAVRYLKDKQLACDVVQETFITLWKQRKQIDLKKSLKSFLYHMVKNRCLNFIRDHEKLIVNSDLMNNELTYTQPIQFSESHSDDNELGKKFRAWIDTLPERQKETFELSRFEGLDHREIADVLNISAKTVNNHIVAALQYLRNCYETHQNEEKK
ncbi:MAG: RNA polymerase sigma-70 factor [Balneolaceae bacterium]|nr:RNA polymerase sigma-70 factor [Balneolaceae bacterium]